MSDFEATFVQSSAPSFGANLGTIMTDYLPPPAEEPVARTAFTVRLTVEQNDDLQLVADAWNAIDKALGHKRKRKWKPSSVVATFIAAGLDRFWSKASEGRPINKEDRRTFIAKAVAHALEQAKKK